ncbi:MAG TPA: TRAP transporter permease [Bacillota bacterium]
MTPEKSNLIETAEVDIQTVLAEYDRESNTRHFDGIPDKLVRYMLIAFSLFVLWMNTISTWPEQIRRASFIGIIIFMALIIYPARKNTSKKRNYIPWYDILLALLGSGAFFYFVMNFTAIVARAGRSTFLDLTIGIVGILVLMEVCRRVVGLPILIVVSGFIVYAFTTGFSLKRIITHLFYTTEGVIGTPLGVCSTFIVLFIMLGAFLEKTQIGSFFIDIANSIAGFASGGPAKVAVIASALEGMYSGSSVANTVGSGSVTIPVMKKSGYQPEFAAAVEAAASTGGQIMPPIMGAAAFLMAEMTDTPYSTIAIAACLPALLYFTGIFMMVHFEAKKLGLKGLSKEEIPKFWSLFFRKGFLFLPVIVLMVSMTGIEGLLPARTPAFAACLAIVTTIIVSSFHKDTRLNIHSLGSALQNGAKNTIGVAVACSIAGIIVGVVTLTGIGLKLAGGLLSLSGGIPIIGLFFTMIACIILGMGVPTTANYVIMATITAPIVVKLGIPVLAAHMFVFYFGIVADITPPVALAAYAGAAIAKSNPFKTGVTATRLAITAFIVPYIMAFNPNMLLIDTTAWEVVWILLTSIAGIIGVSAAMEGYLLAKMNSFERIIALVGGLLLIIPEIITDFIGIALIAAVAVSQYLIKRKKNNLATPAVSK